MNFAKQYKDKVFSYFLDELNNGKTPNPDIYCNKFIKFKEFTDYAMKMTLMLLQQDITLRFR